jgi:hypothetical protein
LRNQKQIREELFNAQERPRRNVKCYGRTKRDQAREARKQQIGRKKRKWKLDFQLILGRPRFVQGPMPDHIDLAMSEIMSQRQTTRNQLMSVGYVSNDKPWSCRTVGGQPYILKREQKGQCIKARDYNYLKMIRGTLGLNFVQDSVS